MATSAVWEVPVPRLNPGVSGDARVGGTLRCDRGTWNDSDASPFEVRYRWFVDGEPSDGPQAPTRVSTAGDVGRYVRCEVTAINGGHTTTVASGDVVIAKPWVRVAPALSGDPRLGGELHCSRGVWDDQDLTPYAVEYRWLRDGAPLDGETAPSHTVTRADAGRALECEVTAEQAAAAVTSELHARGPGNRTPPRVAGDPRIGGVATCSRGWWDDEGLEPYAVTYQWLRDGEPLPLATTAALRVDVLDAGRALSCRVTAEGLTTIESDAVTVLAPESHAAPQITGDLRVGQALRCGRGEWDDGGLDAAYPVTYAWLRDGEPLAGEADVERVNALADVGRGIACRVVAHGLSSADSAPVRPTAPEVRSAPALDGDLRLGRTVACTRGTWDDRDLAPYAVAFDWLRDGVVVAGGERYTLTVADVGRPVGCRATALGLTQAASPAAIVPAPRLLAAPALSGDPRPGQLLRCGRGAWDDPDGAAYDTGYGWLRDGTPIAGAAADTLTLGAADAGRTIRCVVTVAGIAAADSPGVEISDAPGTGAPENRLAPFLTGTPRLRATLTCDPGTWTGATGFAYRWLSDGAPVGAGAVHVVAAAELGRELYCEVTSGGVVARSASVTPPPPVAVGVPEITGDPRLRRTLSCSRGAWDEAPGDPYQVAYEWLRGATPVASGPEYTLTAPDLGQPLRCRATAEGRTGAESGVVVASAPRNLVAPALAGDPRLGRRLECGRGEWDDLAADRYAVERRWLRDGLQIATGESYIATAADVDRALACEVVAEGAVTARSAALEIGRPVARAAPEIAGHPRVRQTLTCSRGDWDDLAAERYAVERRWLRDGVEIATGDTHATAAADVGAVLTCEATAAGLTTAVSEPLAIGAPENVIPPAIGGDPRLGRTLACSRGDWDDTAADRYAVERRWLRGGHEVGVGASYVVDRADVGEPLVCEARAEGFGTAVSAPVAVTAPEPLFPPALSGELHLGGQARCERGTWDDVEGARYAVAYQWLRDGLPIAGATSALRTIARGDLDAALECVVTAEALTDVSSGPVTIAPPQYLNWPAIVGPPHPGRIVTCPRGGWNDRESSPYSIAYRWFRDGEPIIGATASTLVVAPQDVGRMLGCVMIAEGEFTSPMALAWVSWAPLAVALAAKDDAPPPEGAGGYTLRVSNPNPEAVPLTGASVTLPPGFTYSAGSSRGAGEPVLGDDGLTLAWDEDAVVAPAGATEISFDVTVASEPGDYYAAASVDVAAEFGPPVLVEGGRVTVEAPFDAAECTILGTPGPDVLTGTPGDDVICGLGGDDVLSGGGGDDVLHGGAGDDRLFGDAGDDVLLGGTGADLLDGGAGADVLRGGGGALDTATYADRVAPVAVTIGSGADDGAWLDSDDDGVLDTPIEHDDVAADIEIVIGGLGADRLTGSLGDEELIGGAGDDTIDGGAGSDVLDGGPGNDTLFAFDQVLDRLLCGAGIDSYHGDDVDRILACEIDITPGGVTR